MNWTWNFGDGSISYEQNPSHQYADDGIYDVTLIVRDDDEATDSIMKQIEVKEKDTIPPNTQLFIRKDGEWNKVNKQDEKWYNHNILLALTSSDNHGVAYTKYRLDGRKWNEYKAAMEISKEGWHILEYYSVDDSGNVESIKSFEFGIDKSTPSTIHSLNPSLPDGKNGWYVSNVTVTLTASDGISGISHTFYRVDGNKWQEYKGAFIITQNGNHTIQYYSMDNAGNVENIHSFNVKIDVEAPFIEIVKPEKGIYLMDRKIASAPLTIVIGKITIIASANDNIGIEKVEFYIDGKLKSIDNETPYSWQWNEMAIGKHEITVKAYDEAGNVVTARQKIWIFNLLP